VPSGDFCSLNHPHESSKVRGPARPNGRLAASPPWSTFYSASVTRSEPCIRLAASPSTRRSVQPA
jgi:hypothetical protein